ncbi:MAG: PEGA domain-containing protein [Leptospiraceae bacterium]|nr:PEGA domain-containing protein [Leptospiraceae bacterium]
MLVILNKKVSLFFRFILFLFSFIPIFAVDKFFEFPNQYLPESVEFEKNRKLCIFPFRSNASKEYYQYLSEGIPSVIYSGLNGFQYVFDPSPMPIVILHEFGKSNDKKKDALNFGKKESDFATIEELNAGKQEKLPEKDPRYIKLTLEILKNVEAMEMDDTFALARKNNCFYIITGEFKDTSADSLQIKLELTDRRTGKTTYLEESTSIKRAYQEFSPMIQKIKSKFLLKEPATISIETENESEAFVFLDGELIGKTPLLRNDIFPGKHTLMITKPDFERIEKIISPEPRQISKYSFPLKKIETLGEISIVSEPEDAEVYLGNKFIGKTPLVSAQVKLGKNRVRISKEGHIDYFHGVNILKDEKTNLKVKLKVGETEVYYKNRLNVFLDYNYFDFAIYSLYGTIAFYGAYMYSGFRLDEERDKLNGRNYTTSVAYFQSLSTLQNKIATNASDAATYQEELFRTIYIQQTLIDRTERDLNVYKNIQTISLIGAGSMLISTGIFYYLGISSDALEFGFRPPMNFGNQRVDAEFRMSYRY